MDDLTLAGRVAVVTGGSRGIGRAIAVALAQRGASVAICDREREEAGHETAAMVRALHVRALVGQCDVSDEASVGEFFGRVRAEFGPADILVNGTLPGTRHDALVLRRRGRQSRPDRAHPDQSGRGSS